MLKHAKHLAFQAASVVFPLALGSRWRRSRLLILCYHGVSLRDEHEWKPWLYVPPEFLRARFKCLREQGCCVLPLAEAIERLYRADLPPRSVALTFDDGFHDFYEAALPVLREFSYPATVYLASYYSARNLPVFDLAVGYFLWQSPPRLLEWPGVLPGPVMLDRAGKALVFSQLRAYVAAHDLGGLRKDELLAELAERLGADLGDLRRSRMLHLMNPEEVSGAASQGIDIQLHTHRHRLFPGRDLFLRELEENRAFIRSLTGRDPRHFCYPGGCDLPDYPKWLRERDIISATTCEFGLASPVSDPYRLPRLLDSSDLPDRQFRAWVSGVAAFVPRRSLPQNRFALVPDESAQ